ncbi:hypothetical protein B0H13DRAFT_2354524 [Mycena leptocephala]|nr:hypothetical protein B0H13DRAFT_2354524 [Mycena leptocephala]
MAVLSPIEFTNLFWFSDIYASRYPLQSYDDRRSRVQQKSVKAVAGAAEAKPEETEEDQEKLLAKVDKGKGKATDEEPPAVASPPPMSPMLPPTLEWPSSPMPGTHAPWRLSLPPAPQRRPMERAVFGDQGGDALYERHPLDGAPAARHQLMYIAPRSIRSNISNNQAAWLSLPDTSRYTAFLPNIIHRMNASGCS